MEDSEERVVAVHAQCRDSHVYRLDHVKAQSISWFGWSKGGAMRREMRAGAGCTQLLNLISGEEALSTSDPCIWYFSEQPQLLQSL